MIRLIRDVTHGRVRDYARAPSGPAGDFAAER